MLRPSVLCRLATVVPRRAVRVSPGRFPRVRGATEPVPAGVAAGGCAEPIEQGGDRRRRRRRRPVGHRAADRLRRRRRRGRARPARPRPTGGAGPRPRREPTAVGSTSIDLGPVSVGLDDGCLGERPSSVAGLGRRGQRERGERVGPDEDEQVGGITGRPDPPGPRSRPPAGSRRAGGRGGPSTGSPRAVPRRSTRAIGRIVHVRAPVQAQRHLLALAKRHHDPSAVGDVGSEPAGELVADAVGRDPAGVALADDGCGDGQDRHRDQGDRRDARHAGRCRPLVLRWRRLATSHAPPAPTATADSTARPAKLRAFSPRLAAYRAAGASPIAATRRRRGPGPGERSARQATIAQPAIAIATRNAVERSTRSATSTSRASMTDSALSGKSWPVETQTTIHHQAAVRTAAPMKTAASRARRAGGTDPTRRDRQDEQRQGRLLDQDREAEQDATDGPASSRRSPDGQQGRDDRGRLREVDAERRDQAPDECRRDQRERRPDGAARPGEEPAEPKRPGQREQAQPERHQPGADQRVATDERAAGRERQAVDRRAQQEGRAARRDRAVPVEDRQPDVQVAGVVGCQRRPATEGDPEHGEDDERRDEAEAEPAVAGQRGLRRRPRATSAIGASGAPRQHVPDRSPGRGESARGKDPPGDRPARRGPPAR